MENKVLFTIPFSGLPVGVHEFEFEANKPFFEQFEYGDIKDGKVKVDVTIDKKVNMVFAEFTLKGIVKTTCDRCLDEIEMPVDLHFKMFGKEEDESDEQVIDEDTVFIIAKHDRNLDFTSQIKEFIELSLPLQRSCALTPKKKCNKEVEKKLKDHLVNKDNSTSDPRWDALKNLKLK